jgi:hypothetical protein
MGTRTIDEGGMDEKYGFTLQVRTENTQKEGFFMRENRFFVEGEGNIKYSYNNGHIANDPVLASQNFLKALEKMPSLIETHEAKAETPAKDIPALQEVVKTVWRSSLWILIQKIIPSFQLRE